VDEDNYSQPRALFKLLSPDERQRLFDNTARSLASASIEVQVRHVRNCTLADPAYGAGVAAALKRQGANDA
jgi:catalase